MYETRASCRYVVYMKYTYVLITLLLLIGGSEGYTCCVVYRSLQLKTITTKRHQQIYALVLYIPGTKQESLLLPVVSRNYQQKIKATLTLHTFRDSKFPGFCLKYWCTIKGSNEKKTHQSCFPLRTHPLPNRQASPSTSKPQHIKHRDEYPYPPKNTHTNSKYQE